MRTLALIPLVFAAAACGKTPPSSSGSGAPPPATTASVSTSTASPAATPASWLTRCRREIGGNNDRETGRYLFQTRGKSLAAGAQGVFDYKSSGSGTGWVYPTAAKDLMNPYGGASISVGFHGAVDANPPHGVAPSVGSVGLGAIAKNNEPLAGVVKMKLVLDGKTFGPYEPNPESAKKYGQYSVWLDTAATDGDSKPPVLSPADFSALAAAIDAMKSAELVIERDGTDVARQVLPLAQRTAMRDAFVKWVVETRTASKGDTIGCHSSDALPN